MSLSLLSPLVLPPVSQSVNYATDAVSRTTIRISTCGCAVQAASVGDAAFRRLVLGTKLESLARPCSAALASLFTLSLRRARGLQQAEGRKGRPETPIVPSMLI